MSARSWIIGLSLLSHGGLVYALGRIEEKKKLEVTAIEVFEQKAKEPPKPPPAKVDTPPPEPKAERNSRPKSVEAAPEQAPDTPLPTNAALSDLPDLGLELSGGGSGPGGLAVASGPRRPAAPIGPTKKPLSANPKPAEGADACEEPAAKPKLLNLPQPAYTEAARAQGIEGKVRLQLTVDSTGKVIDVKVLAGLGHGLDEAAITAAKSASFEGAIRCGKPTNSTFTISMRFSAG